MTAEKLDLVAIGEVMTELRHEEAGGLVVGFAGDTFNTAVYCTRVLGKRAEIGYFTRVGTDPLSIELIAFAQREGLSVDHIAQDREKLIGIYAVSTDETGERSFSYWRENSAARQMFVHDEALQTLPNARISYLSGISLAILSQTARQRLMDYLAQQSRMGNTLIAFDSNYRPSLWESQAIARETISEMWKIADIALPSIDDEMDLFGEDSEQAVIDRFAKKSWHACAIKRGIRGPVSPTLQIVDVPEYAPAPIVTDTTAAGDSFNAGYLASYLQGASEVECLIAAHALASKVVAVNGALGHL